jgi:hypothetical protein
MTKMPPQSRSRVSPDVPPENPPEVPPEEKNVDPAPSDAKPECEFLLMGGNITGGPFETAEQANDYGVATYGRHLWWGVVPVLKARFPKEEEE